MTGDYAGAGMPNNYQEKGQGKSSLGGANMARRLSPRVTCVQPHGLVIEGLLLRSPKLQSLLKAQCAQDGQSLLSLTVCNGHLETVDYLIMKGVDVNAADAKGPVVHL